MIKSPKLNNYYIVELNLSTYDKMDNIGKYIGRDGLLYLFEFPLIKSPKMHNGGTVKYGRGGFTNNCWWVIKENIIRELTNKEREKLMVELL